MVFIKEGTICDMHESLYNNNYNNKDHTLLNTYNS